MTNLAGLMSNRGYRERQRAVGNYCDSPKDLNLSMQCMGAMGIERWLLTKLKFSLRGERETRQQ